MLCRLVNKLATVRKSAVSQSSASSSPKQSDFLECWIPQREAPHSSANVTIYKTTWYNNPQDLKLSFETRISQSIRNYLETSRDGDCSCLSSHHQNKCLKIYRFYYLLLFNSVTKKVETYLIWICLPCIPQVTPMLAILCTFLTAPYPSSLNVFWEFFISNLSS
jgi:hypothetical protein